MINRSFKSNKNSFAKYVLVWALNVEDSFQHEGILRKHNLTCGCMMCNTKKQNKVFGRERTRQEVKNEEYFNYINNNI